MASLLYFQEKVINPKSDAGLLPVIVFIYGGMFMFGRTEVYRPEYFMDTDAVLVTVNYRLGPLGEQMEVFFVRFLRQNPDNCL